MSETASLTPRELAKADRRAGLLASAARLFADRGFDRVPMEDLGSAVGVSGPAVYRHFASKQAVLAALLIGVSEGLFFGGQQVVSDAADDDSALRALIRFHVDFALANPDVIRVQDRDLDSLAEADRHTVRTLQRNYVELWVSVLSRLLPGVETADLRIRSHATFGLINSTPHSARIPSKSAVRQLLERMALTAILADERA